MTKYIIYCNGDSEKQGISLVRSIFGELICKFCDLKFQTSFEHVEISFFNMKEDIRLGRFFV